MAVKSKGIDFKTLLTKIIELSLSKEELWREY
jgi:hypothetical protein